MATVQGIVQVIRLFRDAGLRAPDAWAGRTPTQIAESWATLLHDVADVEVATAAIEWTRRGDGSQWMPTPGQLLAIVRPPASDADLGQVGREAWAALLALRDRAVRIGARVRGPHGGYGWRSDADRERAAEILGPQACAALDAAGGWAALDRVMAQEDSGAALSTMQSVFVADFRTVAKRGRPTVAREAAPAIGAAPRMVGMDADFGGDGALSMIEGRRAAVAARKM